MGNFFDGQLCGIVSHGHGLGHLLGFPTANISLDCAAAPDHGVYIAEVLLGDGSGNGTAYPAIANIGTAPSVSAHGSLRAEFHLLNFSGDLYGRHICARLIEFMRPEKKFSSESELKNQVNCDINTARRYFGLPYAAAADK